MAVKPDGKFVTLALAIEVTSSSLALAIEVTSSSLSVTSSF